MRRLLLVLILLGSLPAVPAASAAESAATGRVVKVLPLFLDQSGRECTTPSLYDRDAYQVFLRANAEKRSAVRFDVLWKAAKTADAKLKIRVELRGIGANSLPRQTVLEQEVKPRFFRRWNAVVFGGDDYKNFGEIVAWRTTLWAGGQMIGEQKSFLW
jgi:hypothetical protein